MLKVSWSAKDTDFAVKLVGVAANGTAWIIGDMILRARYRDGFDRPASMQPGQIYTLKTSPVAPSIPFREGHCVRIEITSSNSQVRAQPEHRRPERPNESESRPIVADNAVGHAGGNLSYIDLPVVR